MTILGKTDMQKFRASPDLNPAPAGTFQSLAGLPLCPLGLIAPNPPDVLARFALGVSRTELGAPHGQG